MRERRNSIANALELRLSCTNPTMFADALLLFILGYLHAWITLHHLSASYILSHNLFGSFVSVDHPTWPRESAKHRVYIYIYILGYLRAWITLHHLSASYILSHNLFGSFVSVDHPTWPRESAKHRVYIYIYFRVSACMNYASSFICIIHFIS